MDGRHKAGHDDQGAGRMKQTTDALSVVAGQHSQHFHYRHGRPYAAIQDCWREVEPRWEISNRRSCPYLKVA
jgi:hypothetical protein